MQSYFEKKNQTEKVASETTSNLHKFGTGLLKELAGRFEGENLIFSPCSIVCAMAILYGGSEGDTRQEFEKVFGFDGLDQVGREYRKLINHTLSIGDSKSVNLANGLWIDKSLADGLRDDFVNRAVEDFSTSIYPSDFSSPTLPDEVNAWVENATQGRIKNLVNDLGGTNSLVANALYFAGKWNASFIANDTVDDRFDTIVDGVVPCRMMNAEGWRDYIETENSQIVFLGYSTGANPTCMAICLPKSDRTLADSLGDLEQIHVHRAAAKQSRLHLQMPRFKIGFKVCLNEALNSLGMVQAFDEDAAKFDLFCPGFFIGKVIHQASLEVDEEGSVAAAATAIMMFGGGMPPHLKIEPIVMRVDKPFLLAILDNTISSTLFAGAVINPSKD